MRNILLVHQEQQAREKLAAVLRSNIECVVLEAGTANEAAEILENDEVCLLITPLFAAEDGGLTLMRVVKSTQPGSTVIFSVPAGDRTAIKRVLRMGAFAYLNEPFEPEEALIVAARALTFHDLQIHKTQRGPKFAKLEGFHGIIGQSPPMQELFSLLEKFAEDDASTVLVLGESGTGKELVARAVHARGPRQGRNFVPVNCAAIPDELLESELFGYVKGAFTGAAKSKIGRIQYAQGGTLFLDEIGDMKPNLQAKLLRVLQEREFEPVGGVKPVPVDIRIIAATHQDLEAAVAAGRFREDLFYRLNVLPVIIPPLRERKEDIPLLIERFTHVFNRSKKVLFQGFDERALRSLRGCPWPGNVRELENLIQRMAILHRGSRAGLADLPEQYRLEAPQAEATSSAVSAPAAAAGLPELDLDGCLDFDAIISEVENRLLLHALSKTNGNKKEAAELLKMKRTTFLQKVKKKRLEFSG